MLKKVLIVLSTLVVIVAVLVAFLGINFLNRVMTTVNNDSSQTRTR